MHAANLAEGWLIDPGTLLFGQGTEVSKRAEEVAALIK
jgi:hypothetical protein